MAGWVDRNHQNISRYFQEEANVLKEQLGERPDFRDDQCCGLAAKAKKIGLKHLKGVAAPVTPRNLLDWHQRLPPQPAEKQRPFEEEPDI